MAELIFEIIMQLSHRKELAIHDLQHLTENISMGHQLISLPSLVNEPLMQIALEQVCDTLSQL